MFKAGSFFFRQGRKWKNNFHKRRFSTAHEQQQQQQQQEHPDVNFKFDLKSIFAPFREKKGLRNMLGIGFMASGTMLFAHWMLENVDEMIWPVARELSLTGKLPPEVSQATKLFFLMSTMNPPAFVESHMMDVFAAALFATDPNSADHMWSLGLLRQFLSEPTIGEHIGSNLPLATLIRRYDEIKDAGHRTMLLQLFEQISLSKKNSELLVYAGIIPFLQKHLDDDDDYNRHLSTHISLNLTRNEKLREDLIPLVKPLYEVIASESSGFGNQFSQEAIKNILSDEKLLGLVKKEIEEAPPMTTVDEAIQKIQQFKPKTESHFVTELKDYARIAVEIPIFSSLWGYLRWKRHYNKLNIPIDAPVLKKLLLKRTALSVLGSYVIVLGSIPGHYIAHSDRSRTGLYLISPVVTFVDVMAFVAILSVFPYCLGGTFLQGIFDMVAGPAGDPFSDKTYHEFNKHKYNLTSFIDPYISVKWKDEERKRQEEALVNLGTASKGEKKSEEKSQK